jgi:two-component system response regulator QseB
MRLLLVEDNAELAALIASGLRSASFAIDVFSTLAEAVEAVVSTQYDGIILDIGLPDGDGRDLLRGLRSRHDSTPVLILTARDEVTDRVAGLDLGADDYLQKPFATEELAARMRALLRRPGSALGVVLSFGDLSLDSVSREVRIADRPVALSRRETDALEHLIRRAGRVVTKRALEDGIYTFDDEVAPNTIEVLVSRLRRRLQEAGATVSVHTIRNVGYVLMEAQPPS